MNDRREVDASMEESNLFLSGVSVGVLPMARIEKGKSRNNGSDPRCGPKNRPIKLIQPYELLTCPVVAVPISHHLHPKVAHRIVKLSRSL
jgi:hypothetical protein